jgi:hypothetical protein
MTPMTVRRATKTATATNMARHVPDACPTRNTQRADLSALQPETCSGSGGRFLANALSRLGQTAKSPQ